VARSKLQDEMARRGPWLAHGEVNSLGPGIVQILSGCDLSMAPLGYVVQQRSRCVVSWSKARNTRRLDTESSDCAVAS